MHLWSLSSVSESICERTKEQPLLKGTCPSPLYFASVHFSATDPRARADTLSHKGREVFPPALTRGHPRSKVARGLPSLPHTRS